MMKPFQQMVFFILLLFVIGLTACSNDTKTDPDAKLTKTKEAMQLAVYKSPDCGCCGLWMDHIESLGFTTKTHHPADLNKIKHTLGVQRQYQSCHTAVSTEGYVFEGHIPAPVMQRFLAEKPQGALGLAVPGMPLGSPGMEMGNKRDDYDVLLLKKDGSSAVYERIRH